MKRKKINHSWKAKGSYLHNIIKEMFQDQEILVMEQLRGIDQVAYVRFASVYRKFEDVRAFLEEIERVENELPPDAYHNIAYKLV